jgi:hypothetical protein
MSCHTFELLRMRKVKAEEKRRRREGGGYQG